MTIEEFVEELKKYEIKFTCNNKDIKREFWFRTEEGLCPICALVKAKYPQIREPLVNSYALFLGQTYLNLTKGEIRQIIQAADYIEDDSELKEAFKEMII